MSQQAGPLAIMGGAFDPVHIGHLRTAIEMHEACELAELRLIPSANPPHRVPHIASGTLRRQMLAAATEDWSWCSVDGREFDRKGYSFTVDTLAELREEYPNRSLSMIIGMDAFLGLPEWHRWSELSHLAHIIVAHRPGWQPPDEGVLGDLMRAKQVHTVSDLHSSMAGNVYVHAVTQLEVSSSQVRALLANGQDARHLVPKNVLKIIQEAGCYPGPTSHAQQEKRIHG